MSRAPNRSGLSLAGAVERDFVTAAYDRPMQISFVAGFGPIIRDPDEAHRFWRDGLGIAFEEPAPGYFTNDDLDGVKAFAMWPLTQAAEATFGSPYWPEDLPVPQAWLELDLPSPEAVAEAIEELRGAGHRIVREAHEEPWGQTTARLLSPEGLLVGVTYTPWMHADRGDEDEHDHDDDHDDHDDHGHDDHSHDGS